MALFQSLQWLSNIPLYICVPCFYLFFWQWTFRLLPCLGYCKQCCNEHWGGSCFSPDICPGVALQGYMVFLFLFFSGTSILFSIWQPTQYYCLENPMDRGAWLSTVLGVARIGHDLAIKSIQSVQSLSHVRLCTTSWTAARQASQPITNSRSLPKLMSIELEFSD